MTNERNTINIYYLRTKETPFLQAALRYKHGRLREKQSAQADRDASDLSGHEDIRVTTITGSSGLLGLSGLGHHIILGHEEVGRIIIVSTDHKRRLVVLCDAVWC
jgi:hypothetical protein